MGTSLVVGATARCVAALGVGLGVLGLGGLSYRCLPGSHIVIPKLSSSSSNNNRRVKSAHHSWDRQPQMSDGGKVR